MPEFIAATFLFTLMALPILWINDFILILLAKFLIKKIDTSKIDNLSSLVSLETGQNVLKYGEKYYCGIYCKHKIARRIIKIYFLS